MEAEPPQDIVSQPLSYYGLIASKELSLEEIEQQQDFFRFIPSRDIESRSKQTYRRDLQSSLLSTIPLDQSEEPFFQRKIKSPECDEESARLFHAVLRAENRRQSGHASDDERSLSSSCREPPCNRGHLSQKPSRSSYAGEFDHVSYPQPSSSASADRRHHEAPRSRHTLTAFLVILALASVTAVLIDTKREPQPRGSQTQPVSLAAARPGQRHCCTDRHKMGTPTQRQPDTTSQPCCRTCNRNDYRTAQKARFKHSDNHYDDCKERFAEPQQRETKHRCGMAIYTYCSALRDETYYRHATRSCVRSVTDRTQVCNHSPNRFATLQACKKRCAQGELPAEACFEKTLFSGCNREDLSSSWWFFNGKHCQAWNFPDGLCPDPAGSHVFASRSECLRRCSVRPQVLSRRHRGVVPYTPCRRPKAGAVCSLDLLRFPYFADISPVNGRVECLNSSASQLRKHRCLTGSNRFLSDATCRRSCFQVAMRRGPHHVLFEM